MNILEKQRIIDSEVRMAAERSFYCHGYSLKGICGLNITMYHSEGIDQLRFTFIDDRLPDQYYKYSIPELPEPVFDEIGVTTATVSVRQDLIDLRDRKYKAYSADYPYYRTSDPYFNTVMMEMTNLRPDFKEVAKIIKDAIEALRDIYNENTQYIPEK